MGCQYCENIFPGRSQHDVGVHDRILFESESFVAVPTIGALVEGWLLLITKRHYLCMGEMPRTLFDELNRFKRLVEQFVEDCYGPVAFFEHGPSRPQQSVGCGVDHAHLHVVPTECDLAKGLSGLVADDLRWVEASGVVDTKRSHLAGSEYLYLEQPAGHARITEGRRFGSQLFRRVIARHVGTPNEFDWKLHDGAENVLRTVGTIARRLERNGAYTRPHSGAIEAGVR
jgi:ATP adenylyltransferase